MVEELSKRGLVKTGKVKQAFLNTDRKEFIPKYMKKIAYEDTPLSIGNGQTISAPHMVAIMTELLELEGNEKVLEIGTGSGYQACIIGKLLEKGHVHTTEIIPELCEFAKDNINRTNMGDRVSVICGDGSIGYEKESPYDVIIVTCGAPSIPPTLLSQLKDSGRLIIPVGGNTYQSLYLIKKKNNEIKETKITDVIFVPMRGTFGYD